MVKVVVGVPLAGAHLEWEDNIETIGNNNQSGFFSIFGH